MSALPAGACPPAPATSWLRGPGVLAEERGESIAAHLQVCPACQKLHAELAELRASLGRMPASEPAPGWQRAVFARIEAERKPGWLRWAATFAPVMAAAAIALVLFGRTGSEAPAPLGLALRFEKGDTALRSRGDVAVGDTLSIAASGVAAPVAELRVYRDHAGLVFRCAGAAGSIAAPAPSCTRQGSSLRAHLTVPAIGRYRVLLVTAPAALPALSGNFDADVGAISGLTGASWHQAEAFEVW